MVSSCFLLIPTVVFVATIRWMPPVSRQGSCLYRMVPCIPVFLLAVQWVAQMDSHLFLDLRDSFLLSNPSGTKINDFYYKYTLYPAEVFKSLDQKTLKTCNLENTQGKPLLRSMEEELLNHDYLHVGRDVVVDLKVGQEGNILVFDNRRSKVLRTAVKDFFSSPGTVLREFSRKSDRHAFFRQFTFFSLLVGFPRALHVIPYGLLRLVACLFLDVRTSLVIASILCFSVGIALLVAFHYSRGRKIAEKDLAEALKSERLQERLTALKIIQKKGMEVGDFQAYQGMRAGPHVGERYWLVRALGVSRKTETYKDLLGFLDDPHPNVVSMAFYALGQRGDRRAVKEIIERIETSDDW